MIRIFFRYDDYSQLSPTAVDRGMIEAFAQTGLCCTVAVIPSVTAGHFRDPAPGATRPLAGEKLALLREAVARGVVDVALHGLHHRTVHSAPPHSEFAGVPRAEQLSRIREGKRLLEDALDTRITTFVPPWNTYDEGTLAALDEAGLTGISANRHATVPARGPTGYLPITIELHDLRKAVEAARRSQDGEAVVGVLMHPYDFRESGDERASISVADLARELDWLRAQPDVRVESVTQLLASGRFDAERFAANRPSALETVYPPGLGKTYDMPLYLSARYARAIRRAKLAATAMVFVVLMAVGFWTSRALFELASHSAVGPSVRVLGYVPAVLVVLLVARAVAARQIYFRSMAAVLMLVGMVVAFTLAVG